MVHFSYAHLIQLFISHFNENISDQEEVSRGSLRLPGGQEIKFRFPGGKRGDEIV
jgi:hypothetical protein